MEKNFAGLTFYTSDRENSSSSDTDDRVESGPSETDLNNYLSLFMEDPHEPSKSRGYGKSEQKSGKTRRIIKNLLRGIIDFIISDISLPYLEQIKRRDGDEFNVSTFQEFFSIQKEYIYDLKDFRKLIVVVDGETGQEAIYKKVCQKISVVFLKYFAVNWLYQTKHNHKKTYLKLRFKLLRVIQPCEL
jgi:hypothetical protein